MENLNTQFTNVNNNCIAMILGFLKNKQKYLLTKKIQNKKLFKIFLRHKLSKYIRLYSEKICQQK